MLQVGRDLKRITTLEPSQHEGESRDFRVCSWRELTRTNPPFPPAVLHSRARNTRFLGRVLIPNADIVVADVTSSL